MSGSDYFLATLFGVPVLLLAWGIVSHVRHTRMIRTFIESRGGTLISNSDINIGKTEGDWNRLAKYADDDGVIREGKFRTFFSSVVLLDDPPIEESLRREHNKHASKTMKKDDEIDLDELIFLANKSKLKSVRLANLLIMKLVELPEGSDVIDDRMKLGKLPDGSVEIRENLFVEAFGPNLGGLIQGLVILSIGSEGKPLELTIKHQNINMTWSVTGERPNRLLNILLDKNVPQDSRSGSESSK